MAALFTRKMAEGTYRMYNAKATDHILKIGGAITLADGMLNGGKIQSYTSEKFKETIDEGKKQAKLAVDAINRIPPEHVDFVVKMMG